jgi:hypothetical protein
VTAFVLPLLATGAVFGLTYVFCIRPIRAGRGCHAPVTGEPKAASLEISALRKEVRRLRRQVEMRCDGPALDREAR